MRRIKAVPDFKKYEFEFPERGDPEKTFIQNLVGYVRGPGCPVPIMIETEQAWAIWEEGRPSEAELRDASLSKMAEVVAAERVLRRELLCAVLPGLEPDEANYLCNDDGPWREILSELGWWSSPTEADDDTGEAKREESQSTGELSSPSSAELSPGSTSAA